jgi:peptidoglycan hydrolase-like protein with peptidoglycan-binding domain
VTEPTAAPRRRGRRTAIAAAVVVVVLLAGLVAGYLVRAPAAEVKPAAAPVLSTTKVTAGSLASETRVPGTVQYAEKQPIVSGLAGVVTELPPIGATIAPGAAAYRVDTRPVIVFAGTVPAWRDFAPDMTDGEDVRQLEQNLLAFGFFTGEPDARFTGNTAAAIRAWQKFIGVPQTGTVERSMILVVGTALRVDSLDSRAGAQLAPGSPVMQATSLRQVVEVNVKSSDRAVAVVGAPVTITLPSGVGTAGVVEAVAAPVSKADADGTGTVVVVPARIAVTDQAAVAGLALAGVTVGFANAVKDDVLTVPVDALVPTTETEFALELPRAKADTARTLVPVTVGAFASGMVEVSGVGVVDGLTVVVPTR